MLGKVWMQNLVSMVRTESSQVGITRYMESAQLQLISDLSLNTQNMMSGAKPLWPLDLRKRSRRLPERHITKSNQTIVFVMFREVNMKQARVLKEIELKRVLTYCSGTKHAQRNRLAVMISHYAGLRVGEIASLRWEQVSDSEGQIRDCFYLDAVDTKAKEARLVPLNGKLAAELAAAKKLAAVSFGPVIRSQRGDHFSANSLAQVFGRLYAGVGFKDASSHSGRRWFITQLAMKGVASKTIMEICGHKQLSTTQRYIEVTDRMKSEAVQLL